MKKYRASPREQSRRVKPKLGRPSIGIRELKAKASAIIDDVKGRRVSYAVTKRGRVEALIVPSDAGDRLLLTIDSSVFVSAARQTETGNADSTRFLAWVRESRPRLFLPTLVMAE